MIHIQLLPSERRLALLAKQVEFPADINHVIRVAASRNCSPSMISFLKLFDDEDIFENGIDFINQCEELKLCIHEMRTSVREVQYSDEY